MTLEIVRGNFVEADSLNLRHGSYKPSFSRDLSAFLFPEQSNIKIDTKNYFNYLFLNFQLFLF